ncbi:Protein YIP4 [Grifola frondosa]|uniref:Protein YIP4 n=1 Tax=Grifola frondosa TaxID=5627 RepID=A0A1C7M816_GRIFR|nr:Protein YIP4 [Grifola frondosa]
MYRIEVSPLPLSSVIDEDDDLDEDAIPGFSHPSYPSDPASPPPDKGKARAPEQLAPPSSAAFASSSLSGNIGSAANGAPHAARRTVGGVQVETRHTGVDTLDEPIATTIARDLLSIYTKLIQVLYPPLSRGSRELLRDWDLWGPLAICLTLGILLSINASPAQSLGVFTSVVVIIAFGSLVVTIQAKASVITWLSNILSFTNSCSFLVAEFLSSKVSSVNFLDGTKIEQQRILLAVYPLLLFYFILAWMIIIQ